MRNIYTKIKNSIKFGFITRFIADDKNIPVVEVSYLGKTGLAELLSPYGLYVGLPKDTQVLVFSVFGVEANRVAIGWSQADRIKDLKEGEVALGNPKKQTYIKFDENGNIVIESKNDIIINNAGNVTLNNNGDIDIDVNGDINITNANNVNINASKTNIGSGGNNIARLGDSVQVDTGTGIGTITSAGLNTSI
jgi:hypothetical protein